MYRSFNIYPVLKCKYNDAGDIPICIPVEHANTIWKYDSNSKVERQMQQFINAYFEEDRLSEYNFLIS